jgi:hypothetical protein
VDVRDLLDFRLAFWGKKAPSSKEKRAKIREALKRASDEYNNLLPTKNIMIQDYKTPFAYRAFGKLVCEKAFVNMLGMADLKGNKGKMWKNEMAIYLGKHHLYCACCELGFLINRYVLTCYAGPLLCCPFMLCFRHCTAEVKQQLQGR